MDVHTDTPALATTEVGLFYLVTTDQNRILFDVGQNTAQEDPSPLQQNMAALGVDNSCQGRGWRLRSGAFDKASHASAAAAIKYAAGANGSPVT